MNILLNRQKQLRSIWWVAVFFQVLAAFTFPLILVSQHFNWEITIHQQALIVVLTTIICQAMRKKPMSELVGKANPDLLKNTLLGFAAGAILMLVPALFLTAIGRIHWQQGIGDLSTLVNLSFMSFSVAVAEEFLFRGFIFQRLRHSTGVWTAQLLIAGYFLLTHMGNPGMAGSIQPLAAINIFIASILFGLACTKTNNLIMPIAFHFMANWVQGTILGFGVSGNVQASFLQPVFTNDSEWLTGGSFGLEASVPGLISVLVCTFIFYHWKAIR
ncbi:CPBP family intramembrane glutamic endopeptidase [Flavihumibacter sp. UBA7668]|uniref:CPBP family intramembrane glutamic endopeptidase n=1 Tax=Flavihumibacter sp. UBA7668 TaxID=1946542 RepID=UPI0025BE718D|nr:type II CAAX endopeptidase family protein [Flavihumibacter sp. UBA7668]